MLHVADTDTFQQLILAVPVCAHVALALCDADACHQLVLVVLVRARATLTLYDYVYLSPCVHTRARAVVRCLHGVLRTYARVQLILLLPWEQRVLLLLHDDAAGYVLLVVVHAYTHASSCVLSP